MNIRRISTILTSAYLSAMLALSVVPICSVARAEPAPNNKVPKADPVMTEELMARLIKFTLTSGKPTVMKKKISGVFEINDGTADLPILQVSEPLPEGKHYLMLPSQEGSKDLVFAFKPANGGDVALYLTDKSGVLRAAAIIGATETRLIINEQAAEKFKAEMQLFAKLAKDLPPTEALAPGNK